MITPHFGEGHAEKRTHFGEANAHSAFGGRTCSSRNVHITFWGRKFSQNSLEKEKPHRMLKKEMLTQHSKLIVDT